MSASRTPRELLAEADRERRKANGADMAMVNYRIGRRPVAHQKTGLVGWLTDRSKAPDQRTFETLPDGVHEALYEALGIVKREAERRAAELEAQVTTQGGAR